MCVSVFPLLLLIRAASEWPSSLARLPKTDSHLGGLDRECVEVVRIESPSEEADGVEQPVLTGVRLSGVALVAALARCARQSLTQ